MTRTTIIKNEHDNFERAPVNSRRPTRAPDVHADVHVPMQSGLAAGLFVMLIFIGICLYRGQLPTLNGFGLAFMVAAIVGFATFLWRMGWASKVIWAIETVASVDINHDGNLGEPSHPVAIHRNNANKPHNRSIEYQNLFAEFVAAMYEQGTAHHQLRNRFNEATINKFRQYAIDIGIARWRNEKSHQAGFDLIVDQVTAEDILAKTPWVDIDRNAQRKR